MAPKIVLEESGPASTADMIRIPGGTFRMGSDYHYPEEAPAHAVTVDSFWIDPTPVTNAQFRSFIQASGYVTWAEIPPTSTRPRPAACPPIRASHRWKGATTRPSPTFTFRARY